MRRIQTKGQEERVKVEQMDTHDEPECSIAHPELENKPKTVKAEVNLVTVPPTPSPNAASITHRPSKVVILTSEEANSVIN